MHAEAGALMQAKRCELLLRPRDDTRRPSIHSKAAALHREQHAGGSMGHGLPGASSSKKNPLRYLSDRMDGQ